MNPLPYLTTMNEQQTTPSPTTSPQQRMKELLSIPDNQKTEAQWDELIELEIALAQEGRPGGGGQKPQGAASQAKKQNNGKPHGGGGGAGGGQQPRKPQRKFYKKPPKPAAPGG